MSLKVKGKVVVIAKTLFDFYLRLVRDYFGRGYYHYYLVPHRETKTSVEVHDILKDVYKVTDHRTARARRKAKGLANCNVVMFERYACIVATEGEHEILDWNLFQDIRKTALRIGKYEIFFLGYKKGGREKISVRIPKTDLKKIRKTLYAPKHGTPLALLSKKEVEYYLSMISPYTFEGIQNQRFNQLKRVNKERKRAGLPAVKWPDVQPFWLKQKSS